MEDFEFTADYSDLQLLRRELLGVAKDAEKSAAVFERAYKKADAQLKKTATASQKYYNEILKVDRQNKSAQNSAAVFEKELKKQEQTVERLASKYGSLRGASNLYEKELNDLNTALKVGAINANEYEEQLRRLNTEYQQFTNGAAGATNRFNTQLGDTAKRMNRMGVLTQQAGYQVGDFLVQVQSGTNWMVAFGQQATQVAGTLTLLGGKMLFIGSALGIAIPLVTALGAMWMRARKENDKTADSVEKLNDELKSLDRTLDDWVKTKKAAEAGITVDELIGMQGLDAAEKQLAEAEATIQKFVKIAEDIYAVSGLPQERVAELVAQELADAKRLSDEYNQALKSREEALDRIADIQRKVREEQKAAFQEEHTEIRNRIELERLAAKYGEDSLVYRKELLRQEVESYNKIIDSQVTQGELTRSQGEILKRVNKDYLEQKDSIEASKRATKELKELLDSLSFKNALDSGTKFISQLNTMYGIVAKISKTYNSLLSTAKTLKAQQDLETGSFSKANLARSGYGGAYTSMRDTLNDLTSGIPLDLGNDKKSGGGGGGSADFASRGYSALAKSLMSEAELLELWREDALVKLAEFNAKELEMLGGHANAKAMIEEEYQRKKQAIQDTYNASTLSGYADLFGALGNLMGTQGKKLLMIQAALDGAATMISAYRAAADAAAKAPTIAGKYAVWASFVAKGVSAVAKIKQIASSGNASSGGSGGSGAISAPSQSAPAAPQRVLIESLDPSAMYSGEALQRLFDKFYEENSDRGYIFQVAK